jgi:hypothetical protein
MNWLQLNELSGSFPRTKCRMASMRKNVLPAQPPQEPGETFQTTFALVYGRPEVLGLRLTEVSPLDSKHGELRGGLRRTTTVTMLLG